jgi:hypothetical protein
VKPVILAGMTELRLPQNLLEKLIHFLNKLRSYSADGVFANKIFQLDLLAGHQIQEFHAIEPILKRSTRARVKVS